MTARSRPSETFGTDSSSATATTLWRPFPARSAVTATPHVPLPEPRRYQTIRALQRDLARCRRCVEAGYPLESLPVVHGEPGRRAYLYGQAPGIVEAAESAPWRGRAGATLRRWLELDEGAFHATFYCAAVTRCYPGP